MPPEARAVIFDLDDTLYLQDQFVLSGFKAAAQHLEKLTDISRQRTLEILVQAFRSGARGRELQFLMVKLSLPNTFIPVLLEVIRSHRPQLALPTTSAQALDALRGRWRLGIVTNGPPDMQARKVSALGLAPLVDTVVYAHEIGTGAGKPDPAPFLEAAGRLGVPVSRTVFVGDNQETDVVGAAGVGMRTIRVDPSGGEYDWLNPQAADATVRSLTEVPNVAERLVEGNGGVHVI